jgi:hypothetical protein
MKWELWTHSRQTITRRDRFVAEPAHRMSQDVSQEDRTLYRVTIASFESHDFCRLNLK